MGFTGWGGYHTFWGNGVELASMHPTNGFNVPAQISGRSTNGVAFSATNASDADFTVTIASGKTTIRNSASNLAFTIGSTERALLSPTGLAIAGVVDATGGAFNGTSTPTSGTAVEITHDGTIGAIQSYARTGGTYKALGIYGLSLTFGAGSSASNTMTLDASGNLLVGTATNGAGARLVSAVGGNSWNTEVRNTATSGGSYSLLLNNAGYAPNDTSSEFLTCNDTGGARLKIYSNGNVLNVNNSYGSLSDLKLKENITDATPKLTKLLKVRIVNYNLKTDPTHKQIGVIAQELEEISPGLIEETPDYAEVEVEPARTETRTVQRQKVEQRESVRYE
ncbi:MAG: tail fiber domain-containing protein, partial [bacterium]|nr:tail fiber domain-containing protein [bacterium]